MDTNATISDLSPEIKAACLTAWDQYLAALASEREVRAHDRQLSPDVVRAIAATGIGSGISLSLLEAGGWRLLAVAGGLTRLEPPFAPGRALDGIHIPYTGWVEE